ncbi:MAG: hypothetical protein ACE5H3_06465 [Planctomycetota bacterium]
MKFPFPARTGPALLFGLLPGLLLLPHAQEGLLERFDPPALELADFPAAAEAWLQALELSPEDPMARVFARRLSEFEGQLPRGLDPGRLETLIARVPDADASLILRNLLLNERLRGLFRPGEDAPSRDLYPEFVRRWLLAGPFGPLGEPDPLVLPQAPEEELRPHYPEDLPGGGWSRLSRPRTSPRVDLPGRIHPRAGAWYLLAYLHADRAEPATLEILAQGRFRAFWNGAEALSLVDLRHPEGSSHRGGIRLQAGWNALLVKCDGGGAPRVGARVLDAQGKALLLQEGADDFYPPVARSEEPPPPAFDPGAFLKKRAGESETGQLLFAWWLGASGRPDQALSELEQPFSDAPLPERETRLRLRLQHTFLQAARHLPATYRRRERKRIETELLKLGPLPPMAAWDRISRMVDEDQFEEALQAAETLVRRFPAWPGALDLLARVMLSNPFFGEPARQLLQEAVRNEAADAGAHAILARMALDAGDSPGGRKELEEALRLDGRLQEARSALFQLLLSGTPGEREHARSLLRRWRSVFPRSQEALRWQRRLLRLEGRSSKIVAALDKATRRFPGLPRRWNALGLEYLRMARDAEAVKALEEERALEPADPALRQVLSRLEMEPDPAQEFFETFQPDREEALAHARDRLDDPGAAPTNASLALALDSAMVYLFPHGGAQERTHTVTVALDQAGRKALHEEPARSGARRVQVLNSDGQVSEPLLVKGKWVMPALDPGDAVEVEFDSFLPAPPGEPPDLGWFRFRSFEEIYLRSRYVVFVPDGLDVELRMRGFHGSHDEVRWKNGTVHTFLVTDNDPLPGEPLRPPDAELLPWVEFGRDSDLAAGARLLERQVHRLAALPADLAAAWRELDAGEGDALPRAGRLFRLLQDRITDFQGASVSARVWTERRGQPIFLFGAMLEAQSIPFTWAFSRPFSPRLDPGLMEAFQLPTRYSVPLIRLAGPEGPVWVLFQLRGAPFGRLPESLAGAEVLILDPAGPRLEHLPTRDLEDAWSQDFRAHFEVEPLGDARVEGEFALRTYQGTGTRTQVAGLDSRRREAFVRRTVAALVPGLALQSFSFADLDQAGAPLRILFEGRISGFLDASPSGFACRRRLPPANLVQQLGPAIRTTDLFLPAFLRNRARVRIDLPPGFRFSSAPRKRELQRDGFLYRLEVLDDGPGSLEFQRTLSLYGLRLPKGEVAAFQRSLRGFEQEEEQPLLVTRD